MGVTFSPEARARGNNPKWLDEVENGYARVAALRMPRIDGPALSPVAKIPVKVLVLLQVGLRRVLELTESVVDDVNKGLFTPPFVTARAALETSALLYRAVQKVEPLVRTRDRAGVAEFDEWLKKALLGGRSEEWAHPEQPEAINALTIIDQLTKNMPNLRPMYELLCEYAHPNYDGMMAVYQKVDRDTSVLIDRPVGVHPDLLNTAIGMAGFALLLTGRAVTRYREGLLSEFTGLCEEDVKAQGT